MTIKCPHGETKLAAKVSRCRFTEKAHIGDKNAGVIDMQMTFKAIRSNEITRTMRADRKKIIRVLGHSNIKSSKKKKNIYRKGLKTISQ